MTTRRILLSSAGAVIACVLLFTNSCRDEETDLVCPPSCSPCSYLDTFPITQMGFPPGPEMCDCVPDTVNYYCDSAIVNGYFDYNDSCKCLCYCGWTGALCDQVDTNYHVRFKFGADTTAFSGFIRTNRYDLSINTWKFYDFTGTFPPGFEIDSIILTQLPPFPDGDTSYLLCETGCTQMEVVFASGASAHATSGVATVDDIGGRCGFFGGVRGTFSANVEVSGSGEVFYIREGMYDVPY